MLTILSKLPVLISSIILFTISAMGHEYHEGERVVEIRSLLWLKGELSLDVKTYRALNQRIEEYKGNHLEKQIDSISIVLSQITENSKRYSETVVTLDHLVKKRELLLKIHFENVSKILSASQMTHYKELIDVLFPLKTKAFHRHRKSNSYYYHSHDVDAITHAHPGQ